MEASTTIKSMLAGNRIFVPSYQRAYSWDTEIEKSNSLCWREHLACERTDVSS